VVAFGWAMPAIVFYFLFFKIKRVKGGFRYSVLLYYANRYFSCLMLMCQSLIGRQKPHCLIEVIPF
jgi:hypothetical protein